VQRRPAHSAAIVTAAPNIVHSVGSLQTDSCRAALEQRERARWACGDYAVIGKTFQIVGEDLAEFADLRAGERVLDVAAGCGNATLAAARRFARVTSTDLVAALLDRGRERARAEALPADFQVAAVEALPFVDASFDVVLSTFGAMYATDAAAATCEMRRVLKPGGRIALASWTPKGFVGRLFKLMSAHLPAPRGLAWPARWGSPGGLAAIFDVAPAEMHFRRRHFHFRYRSAAHWVQVFRDFHGPTHKVFAALDAPRQMALERDITALLEACNTAGTGSLVVPAEYLEAVITPSAPLETPHTSHPH
jgi:ubiquinone/menaquinone biosynthesis C-methylase UbiE